MKEYSLEQQVLVLHSAGQSRRGIADILGIDKSKVQRIIKSFHDASLHEDNPNYDTPYDQGETHDKLHSEILLDECETVNGRFYDTLDDTADIQANAANTSYEKATKAGNETQITGKAAVTAVKTYTLAETKLLMRHVSLLEEEASDFVFEMIDLHVDGAGLPVFLYQLYMRRMQRLIQSAKLLCTQLQVEPGSSQLLNLLVSIQVTLQEVLSSGEKYHDNKGQYWLDIAPQDTKPWKDSLDAGLVNLTN